MAPLLVLFDVDGTLLDAAGAGKRALGTAFRRVLRVDGFEQRTEQVAFAGRTDPRIVADLAAALTIAPARLERERERLYRAYYDALGQELARDDPRRRVLPGVVALLEALGRREGVRVGLLTGNLEHGARIKLAAFGLERYFAGGGFGSDHVERREIARLAVARLETAGGLVYEPSRVWVIGDTEHDVACARANGYRSLAVQSGWVPRERLERAGPDALLDTLEDTAAVLRILGLDEG